MIKTILYIGSHYEYSIKNNGESLNKKAFYDNFVELGYDITPIWYDNYNNLQVEIIKTANNIKPDLIFFILQEKQIIADTLRQLQRDNHFVVNWFGDDQWRFEDFTSKYANYFDVCITTDKFSMDKYKAIGQNNVVRSQWASLDSDIDYKNIEYKYDISFIGGANAFRKWFVKELSKRGIIVHCFGNGWDNGRVTYVEMEEIFLTSKINLNISNSINYDIRYLMSNLRVFLSTLKAMIKGGKNSSQTKARNFEIPVQGGFQLTDYVPTLEDYFDIGRELICYNDIDEAEKLIKYYLKHENEREDIKISGIKKARENHTFKHRIIEYMKDIERIKGNNLG